MPDLARDPGVRVFAPPRTTLFIALACLAFFVPMTVVGVWVPLANPDGSFARRVMGAIVLGGGWAGFAALSVVLLLAYRRMRVFTSDSAVRVVGVFRTRTVVLAEVTRAVWRGWPVGGSLVLHGPAGRVVIEFASYAGGGELAQFFRAALPAGVQERFDRFEAVAVPTSEAFRRRHGTRTWRAQVPFTAFLVGFGLLCLGLGIVWQWDPRLLVTAAVNLVAGAYFARAIQRQRRAERAAA